MSAGSVWGGLRAALTAAAMRPADTDLDAVRTLARDAGLRCVVLVEGVSDAQAVTAAAEGRRLDLRAERVCVVPMGGATNIAHYVDLLGPDRLDVRVAGLYDVAEETYFRRALRVADGPGPVRSALAAHDFFACVEDLEAELIRAAGIAGVEQVIRANGDGRALDTFRRQPDQRDRAPERQVRRFLGTMSGRKSHYGRAIVEALPPSALPAPLEALLTAVTDPMTG